MQKPYLIVLYVALGFITAAVIVTRGKPVLVRKRVLLGLLILSVTTAPAALVSCRSTNEKSVEREERDVWQSEGWVDEDTFRILATGPADRVIKDAEEKKKSARNNAVRYAQSMIAERFNSAKYESCGGMVDYDTSRFAVQKQFGGIIKNGRIIAERFYEDFSCDIIYEVKSPGLKEKILGRGYN